MKKPWADGTHALLFEPLAFIARLVALIPPPRFHMLRFAGVLCAHATLRKHVVPAIAVSAAPAPTLQLPLFGTAPPWLPSTPLPKLPAARPPARHPWPMLMQHVFAKDVLQCPRCQGRLRLVEVATTPRAEDLKPRSAAR